jgi:hypothetical protein
MVAMAATLLLAAFSLAAVIRELVTDPAALAALEFIPAAPAARRITILSAAGAAARRTFPATDLTAPFRSALAQWAVQRARAAAWAEPAVQVVLIRRWQRQEAVMAAGAAEAVVMAQSWEAPEEEGYASSPQMALFP